VPWLAADVAFGAADVSDWFAVLSFWAAAVPISIIDARLTAAGRSGIRVNMSAALAWRSGTAS
jgi:hypothetical protein